MRKRVYKQQPKERGEEKPGVQPYEERTKHTSMIERNAYVEAMMNSTSDAIIALDQDFHIRDLNPAAVAALGCSMEEAHGRKCTEVLRCQNLNMYGTLWYL